MPNYSVIVGAGGDCFSHTVYDHRNDEALCGCFDERAANFLVAVLEQNARKIEARKAEVMAAQIKSWTPDPAKEYIPQRNAHTDPDYVVADD